jgi:hypothetical protein
MQTYLDVPHGCAAAWQALVDASAILNRWKVDPEK